jgi:hypothetical protein
MLAIISETKIANGTNLCNGILWAADSQDTLDCAARVVANSAFGTRQTADLGYILSALTNDGGSLLARNYSTNMNPAGLVLGALVGLVSACLAVRGSRLNRLCLTVRSLGVGSIWNNSVSLAIRARGNTRLLHVSMAVGFFSFYYFVQSWALGLWLVIRTGR